jgi:flagellum-specific ATP synthase
VLHSISRLAGALRSADQTTQAGRLSGALAGYRDKEDLITLGIYERGVNALLDKTIELKPEIDALLRQTPSEHVTPEASWKTVKAMADKLAGVRAHV